MSGQNPSVTPPAVRDRVRPSDRPRHANPATDVLRSPGPWLLYLAVMGAILVPTSLAIPGPLRGHGTILRLAGLLALALVVGRWLHRGSPAPVGTAEAPPWRLVRSALIAFTLFFGAFGVVAQAGEVPPEVQGTSLRTITLLLAVIGLTVYARLCLTTPRRVVTFLQVLTLAGGMNGLVAAVQSVSTLDWLDLLGRLGFAATIDLDTTLARGAYVRATGTTTQPIEFAVVSGCLIPFAMYLAFNGPTARSRSIGALGGLTMLLTLPLSLSRGGIFITLVALLITLAGMSATQRIRATGSLVLASALVVVAAPQLTSTFVESVRTAATDPSIQGRLQDYPAVVRSVSENPLLGKAMHLRGFILDNQWLAVLVLVGVLGLVLYASVFVVSLGAAATCHLRFDVPAPSALNAAIAASIVAAALANGFLDTFSFQAAFVATMTPVILSGASALAPPVSVQASVPSRGSGFVSISAESPHVPAHPDQIDESTWEKRTT